MIVCKFSDVSERDMDLLFMEEIASFQDFLDLFLAKINLENAVFQSVEQSKTDLQLGESDITVIIEKDGKKYGILIEDKIDADAQPEQYNRYVERGNKSVAIGEYDNFYVFIVAPESYLKQNIEAQKYPYSVSYEECLAYFKNKADNRSIFKAQHIEQAITKQKNGYQVIEHKKVTDFWNKYIDHQEQYYPHLKLISKRGPKGFKARWPQFDTILETIKIDHKSSDGFVDMTIPNAGDKVNSLEKQLTMLVGNLVERNIFIKQTGKSAVLRMEVPKLDFAEPFEKYTDEVFECFKTIETLTNLAKEIAIQNGSIRLE